ncbi:EAL domain-containing protein [Paraburkholderia sp. LEh10]|uniref:EAL domain-containing protein n=1 Tax=Paraburkholderia sp. LEh10 TaxID=2821353 RepID=UPI001FD76D2F|nr:EAL domain-containing protein [Paraburkholderia sp. LEh10]
MSSLGYLRHLPVNYVKIDGSLIKEMVHDPVTFGIVKSINEMSHSMKCMTVAEFVENEETMQALDALGVDFAQGIHIGRPTPWIEAEIRNIASGT